MKTKSNKIPVTYIEYDQNGETLYKQTRFMYVCFNETPPTIELILPSTLIEEKLGIGKSIYIDPRKLGLHFPDNFEVKD